MRILQLCKKFPYPPYDGEVIAIQSLSKAFHQLGQDLTVLAINTKKHFFPPEELPPDVAEWGDFHSVFVNTDIRPWPAFKNLFGQTSYNISRFDHTGFRKRLEALLQQQSFDIIQLEGLYLMPYINSIRQYSDAKISFRAHNIEFEIWERLAKNARNPIKKAYLQLLAKRLKRYEIAQLNQADALVPITEKDQQYFEHLGCQLPSQVIQMGVDAERLIPDRSQLDYPSVFHLGSLDWMPNQEGMLWFLENVWPKVRAELPELRFYMAGRNLPKRFAQLRYPNVEIVGEVPNAVDFMNRKAIMVVPLHAGSGMRIKIMEALALEKTIVSTDVGAEGIAALHGEHILRANEADAFAQAIVRCATDRALFERIGKQARKLAFETYDNRRLGERLLDFYAKL